MEFCKQTTCLPGLCECVIKVKLMTPSPESCSYIAHSYAWWLPYEKESFDDEILRRLKAVALPCSQNSKCDKCGNFGHWAHNCQVVPVVLVSANKIPHEDDDLYT